MCDESWTVGLRLCVVTVGVDQFRGCPTSERNIRRVLHQIAGLEWRPNHTGGDEFVEVASRAFRLVPGRTSSATTRPRTVIAIRSPASTRRT